MKQQLSRGTLRSTIALIGLTTLLNFGPSAAKLGPKYCQREND